MQTDPKKHPAYQKSLESAVDRAFRERDATFGVYADEKNIYVRDAKAAPPKGARVVHMVQFWSANPDHATPSDTVQVRSRGAVSEFVSRPWSATELLASLDDFTRGYITTALCTGVEGDNPDGEKVYDLPLARLAYDTIVKMVQDCRAFLGEGRLAIEAAYATGKVAYGPDFGKWEHAGYMFWLTRNGHGSGFWDGRWPEPYADQLDKLAKRFGEYDLYIGDDDLIHGQG